MLPIVRFLTLLVRYKIMNPVRIGPVRLDCDGAEPHLAYKPLRDLCPNAVELVGSVRRFSDQHVACVLGELDDRCKVVRPAAERTDGGAERLNDAIRRRWSRRQAGRRRAHGDTGEGAVSGAGVLGARRALCAWVHS